MKFEELLICAKLDLSLIDGNFDEDLYQELCVVLMKSIEKFVI